MELTRRQETFIRNLVDLYSEQAEPIHYSLLAERLGVSPFTAYDMLRRLEERGYARSDYHLEEGKRQPGRSIIVFVPTPKAHALMAELGGDLSLGDWENVKEALLERVRSSAFPETGLAIEPDLAIEVLARVPQSDSDVQAYCTEVTTVVLLRIWRAGRRALLQAHLDALAAADGEGVRHNLRILGLGALADSAPDDLAEGAAQHLQAYLDYVRDLEPDGCRQLAEDVNAVLRPLLHDEAPDAGQGA